MPTPATSALSAQQDELEAATASAIAHGLARYAQWQSLKGSAERANIAAPKLFGDLYARNEAADRDFAILVRAVAALEAGTGQLKRWRIGNGPIKWGVAKRRPGLGQWQPVAVQALRFASAAALSAFGWHVADLFGSDAKITNEAKTLQQLNTDKCLETSQQLIAAGHPNEAAMVARECAAANAAADKPDPSWLDSLKAGVATVATAGAIGGGALLLVGAAILLSRRERPKLRSPVQFHKPVSFRRPWT